MSVPSLPSHPLMPACFLHWVTPGRNGDDETLQIVSWRRSLTLKGQAFETFAREVLPLLDGAHSFTQICDHLAGTFSKEDLEGALSTLYAQGIVVEGATEDASGQKPERAPQLGWLGENAPDGRLAQRRLEAAHVVVFGAGGPAAVAARALAAAGIGALTLVDPSPLQESDRYFSNLFAEQKPGKSRADALASALGRAFPSTELKSRPDRPTTHEAMEPILQGATLALCCLDSGEASLAQCLNVACRALGLPWMTAALEGTELVVGPGFFHTSGAPCYMCWRMREIRTSANPHTRAALEDHLAQQDTDLSDRRESLAPAADIVGGLLAAEVISLLSGSAPPTLDGRLLTLTLTGLRQEKHHVLRHPDCPVCSARAQS